MRNYKVEITELLQRIVEVEAESASEAIEKVSLQYANEKIVLDYDDCKEFSIQEYKED